MEADSDKVSRKVLKDKEVFEVGGRVAKSELPCTGYMHENNNYPQQDAKITLTEMGGGALLFVSLQYRQALTCVSLCTGEGSSHNVALLQHKMIQSKSINSKYTRTVRRFI